MNKNESMKYTFPLSFREEVGNCISHGVMAIVLLFSLPFCAIWAYLKSGWLFATGIAIYIICMIFMFLTSCLYHSMQHESMHKYVFRKLDHIMITVAIAGTYTPICLCLMHNWIGYLILAIEWILAIGAIVLKAIASKSYPKLSMTIYMIMGWLAIFIVPVLLKKGSLLFIGLILLGGILYTIGAFFYAHPEKKYFHFIWHIFIVLASIAHLIGILFFMI